LVSCRGNQKSASYYPDGFIYYSAEPFKPGSLQKGPNITTGYIDREIYKTDPLTIQDFLSHLGPQNAHIFQTRLEELLWKTFNAVKDTICTKSHVSNQLTFQLFGVDVAVNQNMEPQLMEINKGPDLGGKDVRDKQLKKEMMEEVFKKVGIINGNSNFSSL